MKKSTKRAAGIAAGIAAAGAAVAAGYYFYGHKDAKKHRGAAVKWAHDLKREVMRQAKEMKDITADDFSAIVNNVMSTYEGVKDVDVSALKQAAKELKQNWELVRQELGKAGRRGSSRAKKEVRSVKRTVKKTAKKAKKKAS